VATLGGLGTRGTRVRPVIPDTQVRLGLLVTPDQYLQLRDTLVTPEGQGTLAILAPEGLLHPLGRQVTLATPDRQEVQHLPGRLDTLASLVRYRRSLVILGILGVQDMLVKLVTPDILAGLDIQGTPAILVTLVRSGAHRPLERRATLVSLVTLGTQGLPGARRPLEPLDTRDTLGPILLGTQDILVELDTLVTLATLVTRGRLDTRAWLDRHRPLERRATLGLHLLATLVTLVTRGRLDIPE
jgi:hypothetical protein